MLHIIELKTSIDYLNFFQKIKILLPNDQALDDIISSIIHLESGCKCGRSSRYNTARNKISFYLTNLPLNILEDLKKQYDTENFQFKDLINY